MEIKVTLGLANRSFWVPDEIYAYFTNQVLKHEQAFLTWLLEFDKLIQSDSVLASFFSLLSALPPLEILMDKLGTKSIKNLCNLSGRDMGHQVLNTFCDSIPTLIACSADTSKSDRTYIVNDQTEPRLFATKNIKFGVREFAMGGIAIGLAQVGFIPVLGCYLAFSDYMRNAVRAAAMMNLKIIFHFTHDSIFVGQDGPTHQPVEQLSSFRAMPYLQVVRPATMEEINTHWGMALKQNGPTAFILSRQPIPICLNRLDQGNELIFKGGYVYKDSPTVPAVILVATGSELAKAIEVSTLLDKVGKSTKIISIPCWERLIAQSKSYQESLFMPLNCPIAIIEAASIDHWNQLNPRAILFSVNTFGRSATIPQLEKHFQLRAEDIAASILNKINIVCGE
ncbi:MAG: hypothetical protein H0T84_14335 [Tatlockia sp.]|nr:hypothetical protein [Tatlockia sp.]